MGSNFSKKSERGNVLIILLIAIILLGLLTSMVSKSSETQSDGVTNQVMDDEISRMMTQASTIGGALTQMVINGELPENLYTNLSTLRPGDAGFETAPHNTKVYHPYGGGVKYLAASNPASTAVASGYGINKASIVTGVGPTDVTVGDILFTARISSAKYCQRINLKVTGSATVRTLTTTVFDNLFTNGTTVTIGANCTPACTNIPSACISNATGTAWGYYYAMFPG